MTSPRYPALCRSDEGQQWISIQQKSGLAKRTVSAYAYALEQFFCFCLDQDINPISAPREEILGFVDFLNNRKRKASRNRSRMSTKGLSNSTIVLWLTVVRLFYDFLVEEQLRSRANPLGKRDARNRGRHRTSRTGGIAAMRRYETLPWIPSDAQWRAITNAAIDAPIRTRLMLSLAYDCALRRGELCMLSVDDIDPGERLLRVRAEVAKTRTQRMVPFSETSSKLLRAYLAHRRKLTRSDGALLVSESTRNYALPISGETWSKSVRALAEKSGVPELRTHTFRHLCLTDLARARWDIHSIAAFAGHRSTESTAKYIHLSGRDLRDKFAEAIAESVDWREHRLRRLS